MIKLSGTIKKTATVNGKPSGGAGGGSVYIGTLERIDFSQFENGSFTEVVDGKEITHSVTFDDSGRPVTIDGVAITWG